MTTGKPSDIYDREAEWASLLRFAGDASPGATLGLVYGRRRQGKSLLLESLCGSLGGFYHQALEQEEALALRALGQDLGRFTHAPGPIDLSGWGQAIDALLKLGSTRAIPIVLDEFPYLVDASPELPSVIQRAFGPRATARSASRSRLVLCGSALSVMSRLLAGSAPLRGRAGLDLLVRPFDYRQAAGFWKLTRKPELAFRVHALLGGTPAYRELLRGDAPTSLDDFDRWLVERVLDPAGAMFREGRYLMAEEPGLADRALYHSILTAIAEGRTRTGQIAEALRRPQTALAHPLNVLEDIGLIRHEADALRQRRASWHITEPIVRFHHAVIRPNLAGFERGASAHVWLGSRTTFTSQILGPHFEELARHWTARYASRSTVGGRVTDVGKTVVHDRAGRAVHEVDVVGLGATLGDRKKAILALGEAKWRREPLGEDELERLHRIQELLQVQGRVDASRARLLLFGASGFERRLQERAKNREVVLVDLERLYRGD